MRFLTECKIPFRSPSGELKAYVTLTASTDAESQEFAPLIEADEVLAREFGETVLQLRESERYEYDVQPATDADLRLRCSASSRRKSLGPNGKPDAGLIETRSYCGTLLLELVEGEVDGNKPAVASATIDVRSVKLSYRSEYRGMLRRLADEMAGLVADARSSIKVQFRSSFHERTEAGWLQIQLELLRELLDSFDFTAALQRIFSFPHERLSAVSEMISADRPIRWNNTAVNDLLMRSPRRQVPSGHPLCALGINTLAEQVLIPRKWRDLDTPENRFVKFALQDFLGFLTHAQRVFEACPGWGASAALAKRLAATVEDWLGRGFFVKISALQFAPFGSPVLQRKAGYRELLRGWQRFRTAAELSWEGGEDLFRTGLRDVASLYEYWLFFELLDWFCRRFRGGARPPVEDLLEGLHHGSPCLRLKKRSELGPFSGVVTQEGRALNARFSYNRRFKATSERHISGSWTRQLHPDYTLTFWPDGFTENEAERNELLVHIHFDAKYRVEDLEMLFGDDSSGEAGEDGVGNYKRQDLLKMHAYRDAIKRSQGAYVLYPGQPNEIFRGFHEILPGLGAFGVTPDENGRAKGIGLLEDFLDKVLEHLGNRTTALERVSYHLQEAYLAQDIPPRYGPLALSEFDSFSPGRRALPPAEHLVLVAHCPQEVQRQLAGAADGLLGVRLGSQGAPFVHPDFARVRHVVMVKDNEKAVAGLVVLREPGFLVFTYPQLREEFNRRAGARGVSAWDGYGVGGGTDSLFALFLTRDDEVFSGQNWDAKVIFQEIMNYEGDPRNQSLPNAWPDSHAAPRLIPMKALLKSRLS